MKSITLKIYAFNELNERAKELAIKNYILWLLENLESDVWPHILLNIIVKNQNNFTEWLIPALIYSECLPDILGRLKENKEEKYLVDGTIYEIVY